MKEETSSYAPLLAMLCMLGCCAFVASTTLIAKTLGTNTLGPALHPLQISAGRFGFAFLTLIPFVLYFRPSFENISWKLHLGRSFSGWLGVTCMFAAATLMPLADATAISFLNPVVAMFLAIPLLKETIGLWRWLAAGIALLGATILIQPGSDAFQATALIALVAACFMGLEVIFIKRLTGKDSPLKILFINNSIGAAISITAMLTVWQLPSLEQFGLLVSLGMLMVTAQFFFLQAMKRADASLVMPVMYTTLVFAAFYDYIAFDVIPLETSLIGAVVIIVGALLLSYREGRKKQQTG